MSKTDNSNDNALPEALNDLYSGRLSEKEAGDAAHSLVGLFEVLLEIHKEKAATHATS